MSPNAEVGLGLVDRYRELQVELAGLVQYINETRRTLDGLHSRLPAASDALSEVTRVTEIAAHNMIDLVEKIMEQDDAANQSLLRVKEVCQSAKDEAALEAVEQLGSLSNERTDLLIRMMTELSFQDLTCQTINKIASTILEVERRVIKLIDGSVAKPVEIDMNGLQPHAGVNRLKESQEGASRQDMVDALLKSR